MSDPNKPCPTCGHFRGFRPGDLGYNPEFDVKPARPINVENPQPDPEMLAEYEEFFGEDGYLQRSMFVDALGGGPITLRTRDDRYVDPTRVSLATASQRFNRGVPLPPKKETLGLIQSAQKGSQ